MNKLFLSASLLLAASLLFSSSNAKYTSPPQSGHYQHNTHNNGGGIQHRQGGVYYEDPSFRTSLIDVMADGLMPWFSTRGAKSAFSALGVTTNDAMKSLLVKILEWVASLIGEFVYSNNF
ncbi:uncharacterized protein [Lepeophtheirus salmonis]|nr:uncharacterized protein LOC121120314 [Lepeophtheirus salmonis]